MVVAWPHEDGYAWRTRATCARLPRAAKVAFFGSNVSDDQHAKAVCAMCPVIADCRAYALASRESWGVWGGMTAKERVALTRRRAARAST